MRVERASDGVVRTRGRARAGVLAAAAVIGVALIGAGGFVALQSPGSSLPETPAPAPAPRPAPSAAPREAPLDRAFLKALPPQPAPSAPEEDDVPGEPQEITVDQLPPGDGTGLDAFPRPGTKPIQRGLIVPDGYQLPPGFVRHHQTTDSGEQLPPILKFHPDHVPPGAPADGVVPPELAPRDMPQTWLEPPPPGKKR